MTLRLLCKALAPGNYCCTENLNHTGDHIARSCSGIIVAQWPKIEYRRTRRERLISLTSNGGISIEAVARILDCPEASIRRDIFHLRREGYYITLDQKQIHCYGLRKDVAHG